MATPGIRSEPPLVVIVGPTASGKTAAAIEIAKRHKGEIICADSRTIYREMNIGTAKPTAAEQAIVPHWGLDLVNPSERFTVADFKQYAIQKITEIRSRGHIPFLVGGTGLYVDSVVFNFDFSKRETKEEWRLDPRADAVIVGIATEKDVLRDRIAKRAEQMFADDVVEEATLLGKKYDWKLAAMTGNIYPVIRAYLEKEANLEESIEKFTTQDWRLAKRQMTWFRPNPFIEWCESTEVGLYVSSRLASEYNL
ncbi:MAG TPA: tRNA (adenosine(37)-N6)-dimethylallyltransferase MiaA [Candidatus Saccharimonadales bacterium]